MNDKELADAIVACVVGHRIDMEPPHSGTVWALYQDDIAFLTAESFVTDWRVAGAMCERVDGVEYARLTNGNWQCLICPPDGVFMKDTWAENESLPRAINEAAAEALK